MKQQKWVGGNEDVGKIIFVIAYLIQKPFLNDSLWKRKLEGTGPWVENISKSMLIKSARNVRPKAIAGGDGTD